MVIFCVQDMHDHCLQVFSGTGMVGAVKAVGFPAATPEIDRAAVVPCQIKMFGTARDIGPLSMAFQSVEQDHDLVRASGSITPVEVHKVTIWQFQAFSGLYQLGYLSEEAIVNGRYMAILKEKRRFVFRVENRHQYRM
jgi:hypothetical protein